MTTIRFFEPMENCVIAVDWEICGKDMMEASCLIRRG